MMCGWKIGLFFGWATVCAVEGGGFETDFGDAAGLGPGAVAGNTKERYRAFTGIRDGRLQLTGGRVANNSASLKLPDLDPGREIDRLEVSFRAGLGGEDAGEVLAISFGAIPEHDHGRARGFRERGGLAVAFVFAEKPLLEIYADGVRLSRTPIPPPGNGGEIALSWEPESGLTVSWAGTDTGPIATPGFTPKAGDRLAITARTGETPRPIGIDDLSVETRPRPRLETDTVILNEIMAANRSTLEDEDFQSSDWIELYNGTPETVQLEGWGLSDDRRKPFQWRFDRREIAPYSYLLVFASDKDRHSRHAPHTNFKLSKGGEWLGLTSPDGETASELGFPAQVEDVAFGRAGGTTGFLATPTPGGPNRSEVSAGPPAPPLSLSHPGGLLFEPAALEIRAVGGAEVTIRYTTDGSIPNRESPVYREPLTVDRTLAVRARAFVADRLPGPVAGSYFVSADSELADWESKLPILVVETFGNPVNDAWDPREARPFQAATLLLFPAEGGRPAALNRDVLPFGRVGIHVRGQSSAPWPRKNYALEIRDERDRDRDAEVLGLPRESDFVLHAPVIDRSLIRNALGHAIARVAMPPDGGVRTRFVELFYSEHGATLRPADHASVYLLMERIKRGAERVPIAKLNRFVVDPEQLDGGYLLKYDGPPSGASFTTAASKLPIEFVYPREPNPKQAKHIKSWFDAFEAALQSPDTTDYSRWIDTEAFLRHHLLTELFKNPDGFRRSLYLSKDRGAPLRPSPMWDFDRAFGNAPTATLSSPEGWYHETLSAVRYPWFPAILDAPGMSKRYRELWRELRGTQLSSEAIHRHIASLQAEIEHRSPPRADEGKATTVDPLTEISALSRWIDLRLRWMDGELLEHSK